MEIFKNRLDRARILSQPETLTYHNLPHVCALAERPRVISDTERGIIATWGANIPIEDHISAIAYDESREIGHERLQSVEVVPVLYSLSEAEIEASKDIVELEDKRHFTGVIINYKTKKSVSKPILQVAEEHEEFLLQMEHLVFLDQTQSGEPYTLEEILKILITSALNSIRNIKYLKHQDVKISIVLTSEIMLALYGERLGEQYSEESAKPLVEEFIFNLIEDRYTPQKSFARYKKIGDDNLKEMIKVEIRKAKTKKQIQSNMPLPYEEIMSAYAQSFHVSRYLDS